MDEPSSASPEKFKKHGIGHLLALCLAWLMILVAAFMLMVQMALPYLAKHPQLLENTLSKALDQTVTIKGLQASRHLAGPSFAFHELKLDSEHPLVISQARIDIDFAGLLLPQREFLMVRVNTVNGFLREQHDKWYLSEHMLGQEPLEIPWLARLPGHLYIDQMDLNLDLEDEGFAKTVSIHPVDLESGPSGWRFAAHISSQDDIRSLIVKGEVDGQGQDGKLWLETTQFAHLLEGFQWQDVQLTQGAGKIGVWLHWHNLAIDTITAVLDTHNVGLDDAGQKVHLPDLAGHVRYQHHDSRDKIIWQDRQGGHASADIARVDKTYQVNADIHAVKLDDWLATIAKSPRLPPAARAYIREGRPQVTITDARVKWQQDTGLTALDAQLEDVTAHATGSIPGISPIHLNLHKDEGPFRMSIPEQALSVDFNDVFRAPLRVDKFKTELHLDYNRDKLLLDVQSMNLEGDGFSASGHGKVQVPLDGSLPYLDIHADLAHGDVAVAHRYWPIQEMPDAAIDWLDHALVGGDVNQAHLSLVGDLDDWPFDHNEGHFKATAEIEHATLAYFEDWPNATDIAASVTFENAGMAIQAHKAKVHGINVSQASANIKNMLDASLELHVEGHGEVQNFLDYLTQTSLASEEKDTLSALALDGQGKFDLDLDVPLEDDDPSENLKLDGLADIEPTRVKADDWFVDINKLAGAVRFNQEGVMADKLAAFYHDRPVNIQLYIGKVPEHPSWPLLVSMQGDFTQEELTRDIDDLQLPADIIKGRANFKASFHIDDEARNPLSARQLFTLESPLRGMQINLPEPLDKPADKSQLLRLLVNPDSSASFSVWANLEDTLVARAEPGADMAKSRMYVNLGKQQKARQSDLPASGLRIRGQADKLAVSEWFARFMQADDSSKDDALLDLDMVLDVTQLELLGTLFDHTQIKLQHKNKRFAMAVRGKTLDGDIDIPARGNLIKAHFNKLYWPHQRTPLQAPATNKQAPSPSADWVKALDPRHLPAMQFDIDDFRFGEAIFGKTSFKGKPDHQGFSIQQLDSQSRNLKVKSQGYWKHHSTGSTTEMQMTIDANDLGKMLSALDLTSMLEGGKTHAEITASWKGAPSDVDWIDLSAKLGFKIKHGRIPEVDPGLGRLLGLIAVTELPKRLALNFSDVLGKGFKFNSMTGDINLDNGKAHSDNFIIHGSAATIGIQGETHLVKQTLDQTVEVMPHVGNSLPILGAVVGGPVGAVAGLAVQGAMGKEVNRAVGITYHLGGTWEEPVLEKINKKEAKTYKYNHSREPTTYPDHSQQH